MFWKEYLVVKLEENEMDDALKLNDAKIFTPMEGRPMGGWVQMSYENKTKWKELSGKAMAYVATLKK